MITLVASGMVKSSSVVTKNVEKRGLAFLSLMEIGEGHYPIPKS